jgi:vancomycin resistance protein YoaR
VFAIGPSGLLGRLGLGRTTPHDVDPVIVFDTAAAEAALTSRLSEFSKDAADAKMDLAVPTAKLSEKLNASFTAIDAGVRVQPAVTGQKVDVAAAVPALRATVAARGTSLTLPLVTTEPEVTTAEAAKVDQLIGTFTTLHPCCAPRVTNIHRMAEIVDGAVIAPGRTFSLNARSGRRTLERGFVNAPAIAEGELVSQVGGGVSQFSTTLFNAAWFSGLTIVKHQPHSKYISRYPPGREATLDYDTIDQVIRNDTDTPIMIRTATTATSVTVALYGHTGERTVTSLTGEEIPRAEGGFSVSVQRRVDDAGTVTKQDSLSWTYTGLD